MTAEEVAHFQELVEKIGTYKSDGFIFIIGVGKDLDSNSGSVKADGVLFNYKMSLMNIALNFVDSLFPDKYDQTILAAKIMQMAENK